MVNFGGIGFPPQGAIRTLAEFLVCGKLTGVRVEGIPTEGEERQAVGRGSCVGSMECP